MKLYDYVFPDNKHQVPNIPSLFNSIRYIHAYVKKLSQPDFQAQGVSIRPSYSYRLTDLERVVLSVVEIDRGRVLKNGDPNPQDEGITIDPALDLRIKWSIEFA